jgi:hypothetical protein
MRSVARVEQGQKLNDKPRGKLAYLYGVSKKHPLSPVFAGGWAK